MEFKLRLTSEIPVQRSTIIFELTSRPEADLLFGSFKTHEPRFETGTWVNSEMAFYSHVDWLQNILPK